MARWAQLASGFDGDLARELAALKSSVASAGDSGRGRGRGKRARENPADTPEGTTGTPGGTTGTAPWRWDWKKNRMVSRNEIGAMLATARVQAAKRRAEARVDRSAARALNETRSNVLRRGVEAYYDAKRKEILIQGAEGRRRFFTSSACLNIACHKGADSCSSLAKQYKADKKGIRKCKALVAAACLTRQGALLGWLLTAATLAGRRRAYSVRVLRWDETRNKLSLKVDPTMPRRVQRFGVEACVSRRSYVLGAAEIFPTHIEEAALEYRPTCPVVPLATNSANCLHPGLSLHPLVRGFVEFERALQSRCDEHVILVNKDGATGNDKLVAQWQGSWATAEGELPEGVNMIAGACTLHNQALVEGSLWGVPQETKPQVLYLVFESGVS